MNIDYINLIVAVAALIWGVIVGIPSIRDLLKSNSSNIYFVIEDNINLLQEITKEIDGLELTYKGEMVGENSYLLKAFIFYLGKEDIVKNDIKKNLKIRLPNGSKIHTYKTVYTLGDLEVIANVEDNNIEFNFELLKNKEYFYFEVYSTIEGNNNLAYSVTHRITNVEKPVTVKYTDILSNKIVNDVFLMFTIVAFFTMELFVFRSHVSPSTFTSNYYRDGKLVSVDSLPDMFLKEYSVIIRDDSTKATSTIGRINSLEQYVRSLMKNSDNVSEFSEAIVKSDSVKSIAIPNYNDFYLLMYGETIPYKITGNYFVTYKYGNYFRIFIVVAYLGFLFSTFNLFSSVFQNFKGKNLKFIFDEISNYHTKNLREISAIAL